MIVQRSLLNSFLYLEFNLPYEIYCLIISVLKFICYIKEEEKQVTIWKKEYL